MAGKMPMLEIIMKIRRMKMMTINESNNENNNEK